MTQSATIEGSLKSRLIVILLDTMYADIMTFERSMSDQVESNMNAGIIHVGQAQSAAGRIP